MAILQSAAKAGSRVQAFVRRELGEGGGAAGRGGEGTAVVTWAQREEFQRRARAELDNDARACLMAGTLKREGSRAGAAYKAQQRRWEREDKEQREAQEKEEEQLRNGGGERNRRDREELEAKMRRDARVRGRARARARGQEGVYKYVLPVRDIRQRNTRR